MQKWQVHIRLCNFNALTTLQDWLVSESFCVQRGS